MASNIVVKISAENSDLVAKMAVAKAQASAFRSELNALAKEASATGWTAELKAGAQQAAEGMLTANASAALFKEQLATIAPAAEQAALSTRIFEQATGAMGEAAGALGIALGVGEIINFGKSVFESAASIDHAAQVAGVGSEALQAYRHAMEESGGEAEDADAMVKRLTRSIGEAEGETGKARDAFHTLGISFTDLQGGTENVLPLVAQHILGIKDAAERAKIEVALFGRSGQEIEPALEALAHPTQEMIEHLRSLGLMMDPQLTGSARKTQRELTDSWKEIGNDVLPIVNAVASAIAAVTNAFTPHDRSIEFGIKKPEAPTPPPAPHSDAPYPMPDVDKDQAALQLEANLAGETAQKRHEDLEIIKEANSALKDQGDQQTRITSAVQARAILDKYKGAGASDKVATLADTTFKDTGGARAGKREENQAREIADAKAQIDQQAQERHIASEEATNNYLLGMGQKSLEEWKTQALTLEDDRYNAKLAGIKRREAADQGNKVAEARDREDEAKLEGELADRKLAINQDFNQRKRQQDEQALQDFIRDEHERVRIAEDGFNELYANHLISASQRAALEQQFTGQIENEILKRFDAEHAGLVEGTKEYEKAMRERKAIVAGFSQNFDSIEKTMLTEEAEKWKAFSSEVRSSLNSALNQMLTQGGTFKQFMLSAVQGVANGFLNMGEKIAEDWIENQIRMMLADDQSLEQFLAHQDAQVAAVLAAQTAQVGAVAAGSGAKSAVEAAGDSKSILNSAYTAAAKAYTSVMQSVPPPFNLVAAPLVAAATFTAVAAFDAISAEGGEQMVGTNGSLYKLHTREAVMPRSVADPMRVFFQDGAADRMRQAALAGGFARVNDDNSRGDVHVGGIHYNDYGGSGGSKGPKAWLNDPSFKRAAVKKLKEMRLIK